MRNLSVSLLGLLLAAAANAADDNKPLSRIAFGCCADQDKPQPVWEPVLARQNDLFIFLGDNIYADTRDMALMNDLYEVERLQPVDMFPQTTHVETVALLRKRSGNG